MANGRWRRNGLAYSRFRRFENKVLKSADSIVAISNELKEDLMLRGILEDKITIVPNGIERDNSNIESSRFESIQNKLDELDGKITVGLHRLTKRVRRS